MLVHKRGDVCGERAVRSDVGQVSADCQLFSWYTFGTGWAERPSVKGFNHCIHDFIPKAFELCNDAFPEDTPLTYFSLDWKGTSHDQVSDEEFHPRRALFFTAVDGLPLTLGEENVHVACMLVSA